MTFLNSALLWGLAAASLPILIHLFSRRRFPRIDFSTLRFLRRLQRQQMRRLQLRQWLLLILRTLAIILIALAFARPALMRSQGLGALSASRISVAIILDASASMQAKGAAGSLFDDARQAADTLLALLGPADRALVVLAQNRPSALTPELTSDFSFLRQRLSQLQAWDGPADLDVALKFAVDRLGSPSGGASFRTEIYVLSDFADEQPLTRPGNEPNISLVRFRPEADDNLAISHFQLVNDVIEAGQPLDLEIRLANSGARDRDDVYYSVFLNGSRVAEDVALLKAHSEVTRHLQITPEAAGFQSGFVQIDEQDNLGVDNRFYFCFYLPERISVLLVGDSPAAQFLHLALAPNNQAEKLIATAVASGSTWDAQSLSAYEVVIFADPPNLSATQTAKLQRFIEHGGGLLIFPGNLTDLAGTNRQLLEPLALPRWGEVGFKVSLQAAFQIWQNPRMDDPLFQGMLRPGAEPTSPHFFRFLRLLGSDAQPLLRLSDGSPLFSGRDIGLGRALVCASSPDPIWSDWQSRGIFAPLIHRLTVYLAGRGGERCRPLWAGQELTVSAAGHAGAANLLTPEGEDIKLPPETIGRTVNYCQRDINPVGVYRLKAENTDYWAAVNVPPGESRRAQSDLAARFPGWSGGGGRYVESKDLVPTVEESRHGKELWRVGLIVGMLILLTESLIGSAWRKDPEPPANEED